MELAAGQLVVCFIMNCIRFLWFLWSQDLVCDLLQDNQHSRYILDVYGFASLTIIQSFRENAII